MPLLHDFQIKGALRLVRDKRLILADDMGLGKTVQAIAAVQKLGCRRVLCIVPKTLMRNWRDEFDQWAGIPCIVPGDSDTIAQRLETLRQARADMTTQTAFCVNWEMIRPGDALNTLLKMQWDALVFDECHRYVCNRKCSQTKGAVALTQQCPIVFFLTGTPMRNAVTDVWPMLYMLDKTNFRSYWRFAKDHAGARPPGQADYGWKVNREASDPQRLARVLAPYMLRRTKAECLTLPPKTYQEIHLEMAGEQKRLYSEMEKQMLAILDVNPATFVLAPGVLAQLTRLKQIAGSPRLIGGKTDGVKLEALRDIADGTDEKMVVASQWVSMLKLAGDALKPLGRQIAYLTGEMTPSDRAEAVQRFQHDPACQYLLCSIMAGGVGITLTAASYMVFLDRMYTPVDNEQMVDRIYRIGQTRPVTIIDLLAKGRVECRIDELLQQKTAAIEAVIGNTGGRFSK